MWGIELQQKGEISLSRQIFLSLKNRILSGQIQQGDALPSTRELSRGLSVSRNTVCDAYDMLWSEGFIVRNQGAPSRVAEGLHLVSCPTQVPKEEKREEPKIRWNFRTGQPDLSVFPWTLWSQMLHTATGSLPIKLLEYSDLKGYEPLCQEIAAWLMRSRSMAVDPGDVFITSGATQAFHVLVNILHREGHSFALERPSHPAVYTIIKDRGYPVQWMEVDDQGANIAEMKHKDICGVYVTPSHQFPLGSILPATRRADLLRLATEKDFYIIEDDYDSEFRYSGAPISPIYSMGSERVVYIGTFSKTLFPALRIGFAVIPKRLQSQWRHYRNFIDVQNPVLEQLALKEFLWKRKLDKHVQHMRRIYSNKRKILLDTIEHTFLHPVICWGDASGMHVALQFPGMKFGTEFINACKIEGLKVQCVSQYCPERDMHEDKLLIGYGHLTQEEIQEGVKVLYELIGKGNITT